MGGMNILPLEFKRDGLTIRGLLYLPNGVGPFNLVILAHGFGAGLTTYTRKMAEVLCADNLACYVFDFTGGSEGSSSDGSMLEMSVLTQKADLLTVLDGFQRYDSVKSIHLLGASQGGLVAAMAAKERKDEVEGLVLLYPAFSIPDSTRRQFPSKDDIQEINERMGSKVGRAYHEAVYDMDAYEEIRGFGKPVLIIHGDQDEVVPIDYSKRALEVYPEARLYVVKGAGHSFNIYSFSRAMDEIAEFVKRNDPEPRFAAFDAP